MAENKRTKQERERDLERIAEMYVRGFRQVDIAERIGVSPSQIAYDLKEIRGAWLAERTEMYGQAKEEELAKLDAVEQEAWDAYRRSQEEEPGAKGKGYGDPRFLQIVLTCIDRRCKILGVEAPTKHEHTGKDGKPIETSSRVVLYIPDNGRDSEQVNKKELE